MRERLHPGLVLFYQYNPPWLEKNIQQRTLDKYLQFHRGDEIPQDTMQLLGNIFDATYRLWQPRNCLAFTRSTMNKVQEGEIVARIGDKRIIQAQTYNRDHFWVEIYDGTENSRFVVDPTGLDHAIPRLPHFLPLYAPFFGNPKLAPAHLSEVYASACLHG